MPFPSGIGLHLCPRGQCRGPSHQYSHAMGCEMAYMTIGGRQSRSRVARSATGRLAPGQVIEVYDALAEVYADHYECGNPDRRNYPDTRCTRKDIPTSFTRSCYWFHRRVSHAMPRPATEQRQ